jgi:hypothetical protein
VTLEDLWEVAKANLPEGVSWGVTQSIGENGGGSACVQVHHAGPGPCWIERSIYRFAYRQGGAAGVLEQVALAIVEGQWTVHEAPPAPPAPIAAQETA